MPQRHSSHGTHDRGQRSSTSESEDGTLIFYDTPFLLEFFWLSEKLSLKSLPVLSCELDLMIFPV